MRPMMVINTVVFLVLPNVCLGNSGGISRELFSHGKSKLCWVNDQLGSIPPSTWTGVILPFMVGVGAVFFLWRVLILQKLLTFIHVLEHEMTHGLTAIACGGKFMSMTVSQNGGVAQVSKSNLMINLAPYCLPLLCAVTLLLIGLMKPNMKLYGLAFAGMLYGNFLRGSFSSLGIQPDIKNSGGKWLSYPIILIANALMAIGLGVSLAKMH